MKMKIASPTGAKKVLIALIPSFGTKLVDVIPVVYGSRLFQFHGGCFQYKLFEETS